MKKTKIIATISGKKCTPEFIDTLYRNGMNIVRLNTAHMSVDDLEKMVPVIRSVSDKIGIMLDTKGPNIRTCDLAEPRAVSPGDILCNKEEKDGADTPFVYTGRHTKDTDGAVCMSAYGLCVYCGYGVYEGAQGAYLSCEYYRKPLEGAQRMLKLLSEQLRGHLTLVDFIKGYRAHFLQSCANHALHELPEEEEKREALGLFGELILPVAPAPPPRLKNWCVSQLNVVVEPRYFEAVAQHLKMEPCDMYGDVMVFGQVSTCFCDGSQQALDEQLLQTIGYFEDKIEALCHIVSRFNAKLTLMISADYRKVSCEDWDSDVYWFLKATNAEFCTDFKWEHLA